MTWSEFSHRTPWARLAITINNNSLSRRYNIAQITGPIELVRT